MHNTPIINMTPKEHKVIDSFISFNHNVINLGLELN